LGRSEVGTGLGAGSTSAAAMAVGMRRTTFFSRGAGGRRKERGEGGGEAEGPTRPERPSSWAVWAFQAQILSFRAIWIRWVNYGVLSSNQQRLDVILAANRSAFHSPVFAVKALTCHETRCTFPLAKCTEACYKRAQVEVRANTCYNTCKILRRTCGQLSYYIYTVKKKKSRYCLYIFAALVWYAHEPN
jgi:hypothetical protein